MGQKGAEGHSGTMRVPQAWVRLACWMVLGIRCGGGHSQFISPSQLHVKVSTASVPGFQNRELKRVSWVLQ